MRFVPIILLSGLIAACSQPQLPLPYVDSTSSAGEHVRTYRSSRLDAHSPGRWMLVEVGRLRFIGPDGLRRVSADNLKVRLQDSTGTALLNLDAGRLFFVEGDSELEFSENVLLEVPSYGQLELDSARWDLREQVFRSKGELRLVSPKGILEGSGIEGDAMLTKFRIDEVRGFLE
jgi:hypothetical protein